MENTKKKQRKKYIFYAAVAILAILLAVLPFMIDSAQQSGEHKASILSGSVERSDISSTVAGAGTLTAQEAVELKLPEGVMLEEFLVSNGDVVNEGDALAITDRVSVMETISTVQENLEHLREEMLDADGEEAESYLSSPVNGKVKEVYASAGDSVRDVMLRHGALALVSTDGLMAVDIECASLAAGDSVTVRFADGSEAEALVKNVLDGVAAVTLEDRGYEQGQRVSVFSAAGTELGSGELYVHNPWHVTAFTGTVSRVYIEAGDSVKSSSKLFYLDDTEYRADTELLAQQHREYEDIMFELFLMYQDGVVRAPVSGQVSGIDKNSAQLLSSGGKGLVARLLANAPNGNDSISYTNRVGIVVGQNADGSSQLKMQGGTVAVDDYTRLSGLNTALESMTVDGSAFLGAPIYSFTATGWQQSGGASTGDVFLFSYDGSGSLVWMIYLGHYEVLPPSGGDNTGGDDTGGDDTGGDDTGGDNTGGDNTGGGTPGEGGVPGGEGGAQTPGGFGGFSGGFGGYGQTEEEFEMFPTEGVTLLSVTPLEELTVSFSIDELDILSLSVGQQAMLTIDALPGQSFEGRVTEINSSGDGRKYSVTVSFPYQDKLISGMNVSVIIEIDRHEAVLSIPVEAVADVGGRSYVYLGYDGESDELSRPVQVETGISDGKRVELLSGLSEGDSFYYAYYDKSAAVPVFPFAP